MLEDIFNRAKRQVRTVKFYLLPVEKQKELLESLYKTVILGLRALVLEHITINHKDEVEAILNKQDDDALFLFGNQHIQDFDDKLQKMIEEVRSNFTYDTAH